MKRLVAWIMTFAMAISLMSGIGRKEASAAEYTTAPQLALNGQWSVENWITDTNEEDWYKVVVPQDGKVTIKLMMYMVNLNIELFTEDLSQRLMSDTQWNGSETAPSTGTYDRVLSAGTYYIKVSKSAANGRYKLFGSFEGYGTGDHGAVSYDSPQGLQIGEMVTGAITETDDQDWYRIAIPTSGKYVFKMSTYMWVCFDIFNVDLSQKIDGETWYGEELEPETKTLEYVLSPGTYYVKISMYNSSYKGKYTLQWSALTQANCPHEYDSSDVSSTYTKKGYTLHTCSKCGHAYKDNYTSKRMLGTLTIYGTMKKGKAALYWYATTDATGYQIRYSRKRNMKKGVKSVKVKGQYKTKKTIKKLKRKKKYYFQIRAFRKEGRTTVYGSWSSVKAGKTR